MNLLLPTTYAGNVYYYALLNKANKAVVETHEHWQKQSFRNRCVIYGANGPLNLIVPIVHQKGKRQTVGEIRISYSEPWQKLHWRSLEAAYRSSPYFEYFEDDLKPLYEQQVEKLFDFNAAVHNKLVELLQLDIAKPELTTSYEKTPPGLTDLRQSLHPKTTPNVQFPEYIQVFSSKQGFLPNLSILDLLFSEGPNSISYLNSLKL